MFVRVGFIQLISKRLQILHLLIFFTHNGLTYRTRLLSFLFLFANVEQNKSVPHVLSFDFVLPTTSLQNNTLRQTIFILSSLKWSWNFNSVTCSTGALVHNRRYKSHGEYSSLLARLHSTPCRHQLCISELLMLRSLHRTFLITRQWAE